MIICIAFKSNCFFLQEYNNDSPLIILKNFSKQTTNISLPFTLFHYLISLKTPSLQTACKTKPRVSDEHFYVCACVDKSHKG